MRVGAYACACVYIFIMVCYLRRAMSAVSDFLPYVERHAFVCVCVLAQVFVQHFIDLIKRNDMAHIRTCAHMQHRPAANGYVCVCDCVIICVFNPNTGMFFGEGGITSQLPFRSNESNIHFNYRLHRWGRWRERERESRQTDNTHIIKLAVRGRVGERTNKHSAPNSQPKHECN